MSQSAHGNEQVSDEEIITVFRESEDPYLTASEIADELSMTRQGVHRRLLELHRDGTIKRKKTGRMVGWWLPED